MNEVDKDSDAYRLELTAYWIEKALESLDSAAGDLCANRLSPAVRSIYYACFYAFSAVLLKERKAFKKHTGVRAALHRDYVKTGRVDQSWGSFYDAVFDGRQKGDYAPLIRFEGLQVEAWLEKAKSFVMVMEELLK